MHTNCFAYDFAYLPNAFWDKTEILTPADLMDSSEWKKLASLCTESTRGREASLYEYFCAVCKFLPSLDGHPMKKDLIALWQTHFPTLPLPSIEHANMLWRTLTEHFSTEATPREVFLPASPWNCPTTLEQLPNLPKGACPMLDADLLIGISGNTDTYEGWKGKICDALDAFCTAGCRQITVTLPEAFVFTIPDLYHVNSALSETQRSINEEHLLRSQLLREIAIVTQERNLSVLLRVLCDPAQAMNVFSYLKRTVGLPKVVWSTPNTEYAKALLLYSTTEPHVIPALYIPDMPSACELQIALSLYSARYPIGALQIITRTDAPLFSYAQARVRNTLEGFLKNL